MATESQSNVSIQQVQDGKPVRDATIYTLKMTSQFNIGFAGCAGDNFFIQVWTKLSISLFSFTRAYQFAV